MGSKFESTCEKQNSNRSIQNKEQNFSDSMSLFHVLFYLLILAVTCAVLQYALTGQLR